MKKMYVTTMPDHIGAFLKASECFALLGVNITRVSYNKAVDSHTLFIDVEGEQEQLDKADEELAKIGYLLPDKNEQSIVLIEFMLRDVPGSVTEILKVIQKHDLNISYMSSQENGSLYQAFKMGLFVENEQKLKDFLSEAEQVCPLRVIDYNRSERNFDNSIFYQSFVSGLMKLGDLPEDRRNVLLLDSNIIMQMLDEKGLSPFKTFESINRFAELLYKYRGDKFLPRISERLISEETKIILIEPPCGSNTIILTSGEEMLFIDCGYALYKDEMTALFRKILPDFADRRKRIFITHADVDHCGLLPIFDEVIASKLTKDCLAMEYTGQNGYREQNPLHKPYVEICKTLSRYKPTDPAKITALWDTDGEQKESLRKIGGFDFADMHFDVYQGKGGHLIGETVLIDRDHKVAFTGDIYVNIHGMTKEQAEYNKYAPVLMTSVDTDPVLCAEERAAIVKELGGGKWLVFGSHGAAKETL